jgi:sterol desaturase/sphingolipid hydroxylase (fatty acid hydroxylase superfamily)
MALGRCAVLVHHPSQGLCATPASAPLLKRYALKEKPMHLIQRYLVLMLVSASLLLFTMARQIGVSLDLAVLVASVTTLAVVWWLERKVPYRKLWNESHGDLATDISSAGVLIAVIDPLLKAIAPLAVVALYGACFTTPLVVEWPFWLQVAVVLLLVEFGKYWAHRLHHAAAPLWWLHAMHHSSERMYFLNGMRFHPLNYIINFGLSVFPVILLGFSPEAILGYLAATQPVVLLQHANIDLRHGALNKIFSTPEVHRWHHSTIPNEANRNFGNALLIWDHVFGTFKSETGFDQSRAIGLFSSSEAHYPSTSGYVAQLLSMFRPPCCRA